jgi:hypothetical protein
MENVMTAVGIFASTDLGRIQVGPPALVGQGAPPSNLQGITGQDYFDSSLSPRAQYTFDGVEWLISGSSSEVFSVTGTANQILANPTSGNVILSLIGPYAPATYTAHGVLVGEGTSSIVAISPGTTGQYLTAQGASSDPIWTTATPQLTVTPVAGASQAMTSNHSYIANDNALTTFTLPATSSVGDILQIVGSALNTGGWKITYTTGQIIWGPAGSSTVTTGNAASAAAAAQSLTMVCVVANTTWVITANSGTITLT